MEGTGLREEHELGGNSDGGYCSAFLTNQIGGAVQFFIVKSVKSEASCS